MEVEKYSVSEEELDELLKLNDFDLTDRKHELKDIISQDISDTDPFIAMGTLLIFDRKTEPMAFLRRLEEGKDWYSLKHILRRPAVFLGISKEEYAEVRNAFIRGKHPHTAERLEIVEALLKKRRRKL